MVDLETLSTRCNAAILSIGAVRFDLEGNLGQLFYRIVDLDSNTSFQRHIDSKTMLWWMKQGKEAQDAVFQAPGTVSLDAGLKDFSSWLAGFEYGRIWCRGAAFDIPILESAYLAVGSSAPWPYYSVRCARTLEDTAPEVFKPPRRGVRHNALDDAVYQAECVIKQMKAAGR